MNRLIPDWIMTVKDAETIIRKAERTNSTGEELIEQGLERFGKPEETISMGRSLETQFAWLSQGFGWEESPYYEQFIETHRTPFFTSSHPKATPQKIIPMAKFINEFIMK